MSEINACKTPMNDHVRRFWATLESETVSITVNIRRDTSSGPYWDGSSFSDAVAKALVADRAALSSAAVAEREPVAWRVKDFADGWITFYNESYAIDEASENGAIIQPLYLDPPPTSELEAEIARLRDRVAELEKALDPFAAQADNPQWWNDSSIKREHLRAARRVREGGKVDV